MVNKDEIVGKIAYEMHTYSTVIDEVISRFIEEITHTLCDGVCVKISGFGKFVPVKKAPRVGFIPSRKERVEIPGKMSVAFKPSAKFKKLIERGIEYDER